jgi:hypothetical protein
VPNLAVKFLARLSAGVVASALIATTPLSTLGAAEECLTKPKGETPPGKHWYYRIERSTKRQCWYLATSKPTRRTVPEMAPDRETKLARSAADAHAEISPTTPATSVDSRGAEQTLSNNDPSETPRSPVASRWPEPTSVFSSATERSITPPFVVGSVPPDASADTDLTPVPPVAPTMVEAPMGTPASLQLLLLGTFGAIAVSWITGSAIHRMARKRRQRKRFTSSSSSSEWQLEESAYHAGIPPWLEPKTVHSIRGLRPGRDAGSQSLDRQRIGRGGNAREIEQLLARFANQAQAEP